MEASLYIRNQVIPIVAKLAEMGRYVSYPFPFGDVCSSSSSLYRLLTVSLWIYLSLWVCLLSVPFFTHFLFFTLNLTYFFALILVPNSTIRWFASANNRWRGQLGKRDVIKDCDEQPPVGGKQLGAGVPRTGAGAPWLQLAPTSTTLSICCLLHVLTAYLCYLLPEAA